MQVADFWKAAVEELEPVSPMSDEIVMDVALMSRSIAFLAEA